MSARVRAPNQGGIIPTASRCSTHQLKPLRYVETSLHAPGCIGMHRRWACCLQTNGDRMEISWRHAEEHAKTAIMLGRRCKPPEAALEASPLTTMGDIASAMCRFPVAKERCMPLSLLSCATQAFLILFGLLMTETGCTLCRV